MHSCYTPATNVVYTLFRLLDIIHDENRLYLVFEFLDLDLKKYMDTLPMTSIAGLPLDQVKVRNFCKKNPETKVLVSGEFTIQAWCYNSKKKFRNASLPFPTLSLSPRWNVHRNIYTN